VPAGDFTVSATKLAVLGTRSGSGAGTVIADQSADVSVTLVSRPVGTVKGTVFGPTASRPGGMVVRMTPEPTFNAYRTVTDGDGQFELHDIEGGTAFTINAQVRHRRRNVAASAPGHGRQHHRAGRGGRAQPQMIGAGSVSVTWSRRRRGCGRHPHPPHQPDPVYGLNGSCGGTAYETTSAADGSYAYPDIPAGNFTITAENASRTLRAEGTGRPLRRRRGHARPALVDNAVAMPYTLPDANTMPFDVAGDGSVMTGKNFIFMGSGTAPDTRGMRLEVVVGGVAVPFLNGDGTIGRLAQSGRELQLDETNAASHLKVTRKVFVPRDGYFARYLETLENTTDAPITIGLRVVTNHRGRLQRAWWISRTATRSSPSWTRRTATAG
jgi:hypothetical protein